MTKSESQLTAQQKAFFQSFGYLVLPGLMSDRIDEITRTFQEVWDRRGHVHDGRQRSALVPFIDQHERLCSLLGDPRIEALGSGLLGEDFNYIGSNGNFYVGDTKWHSDTFDHDYVKIAFYLDVVRRDTGALRVIPNSHLISPFRVALGPLVVESEEKLGIHGRDVPAVALESNPGDVVCFHGTVLHAAYGGTNQRRMFSIDLCRRYQEDHLAHLRDYLKNYARWGMTRAYGPIMLATAGPQRLRHLEQAMANDSHLAELAQQNQTAVSATTP